MSLAGVFKSGIPVILSLSLLPQDTLHLEFEFERSKYHLRDVVLGKVRQTNAYKSWVYYFGVRGFVFQ